jgi:hypothetical protein
MIALALLLAAANPPIGRDIHAFCHERPACVSTQLEAARHFLGTSVMFDAPKSVMEGCLRRGKIGPHVDWTVSLRCLRSWTKGRRNIVERGMTR